jgi:hypothetical protein
MAFLHKDPAFGGAGAQGLSQRTISSFKDILPHWVARIGGDTQVPGITSKDLKRHLVWITTEYIPSRTIGKPRPLLLKMTRKADAKGRTCTDGSTLPAALTFTGFALRA